MANVENYPPGTIDPGKEFHLVLVTGPGDEFHQVDWDGNKGYITHDLALDTARNDVDESGGDYTIYRCIPVKRVVRGNTRVIEIKPRRS